MKRRQERRRTSKKQSKGLKATLLIVIAVMIGLIIWIGTNDWNVEKTLEQAGLSKSDSEKPQSSPGTEDKEEENEQNLPPAEVEPAPPEESAEPDKDGTPFDGGYVEGQKLPSEPTYVKNILIANKKYPLPETFAPGESKEARAAFEEMAAEAKLSSFNLTAFSTYRSYDYQVTLYNRYVDRDGIEAADRYSARPGYSEHQTGLAFDIGEVNHEKHWASSSFGTTEAGKWLLANAHRYGFILRYPNHKEDITGYMHEAWHYRYVGKPISEQIFKKNITLEEYLGIE
ncbi:M15 family metallopeptidase [Sporosarcina aquimarina]|uniref:M15 family metallopeptidase n=1 Tax=Sporosarcina aquimarina TaxID=114975 RepID=UPI002041562D|nr:M15 family metallopeptidase [Sporosarcina aquimarina]MCM3758822.1 M15 family metallopeptidase [Sporosarcina aquimarina]